MELSRIALCGPIFDCVHSLPRAVFRACYIDRVFRCGSSTDRFRGMRKSLLSTTALGLLAVASFLTMTELDRLIGGALASDGHTHRLSAVLGPLALTETEAWADWASAAFSPTLFIGAHAIVGLVFVACTATIALRYGIAWRLVAGVAGLAVVQCVLVLSQSPIAVAITSTALWATVLGGTVFTVLSDTVGSRVRAFVPVALRALYAQRLSAIVVVAITAVSLVGRDGVFEQVPDVYRGWVGYPVDGVPYFNFLAASLSLFAFTVTGVGLFALGRQRARHYSRLDAASTRKPASITPWLLFALAVAVVAGVVGIATGGRSIDPLTLTLFLGAVLLVPLISLALRLLQFVPAPPLGTTVLSPRADSVGLAGDLLVAAWIAIAALGPFKAFLSPVFLTAAGSFDGTRLPVAFTWIVPLTALWLVAGVLLPVGFRALVARFDDRVDAMVADTRGSAATASGVIASAISSTEAGASTARWLTILSRVFLGLGGAIVMAYLLFPLPMGYAIGPVATLVLLVGCWTMIIGTLVLRLGQAQPLPLFQLLRLRATPVVTLLVLLPIVLSSIDGAPGLHAIQTSNGEPIVRQSLRQAVDGWYERQACALTLDDGTTVAPMLLIAAHGGGIRAATWTVDVLRELARDGDCAANSALLSSGVSGGSVGLASFRAEGNTRAAANMSTIDLAGPGALSADLAGLLAGDLVGSVTGIRVPSQGSDGEWYWQDRTALQELTWQRDAPQLAEQFDATVHGPTGFVILNSTDSISNCKVIVSQVDLTPGDPTKAQCNGADAELSNTIDLQDYLGTCMSDLTWATAAELSARFPFVSPAGRISNATLPADCNNVADMQLIDGGLAENSGLGTISDISPELMQFVVAKNAAANGADRPYIVPLVMYIANDNGTDVTAAPDGTRPDILIPLGALLSAPAALNTPAAWLTRLGSAIDGACPPAGSSCQSAVAAVHALVPEGIAVVSPSTTPAVAVPLGWTLSAFSRSRLRLEAIEQAQCGAVDAEDPTEPCLAGGGYGRYGDILDLFRND
jgi:hypothetical protein